MTESTPQSINKFTWWEAGPPPQRTNNQSLNHHTGRGRALVLWLVLCSSFLPIAISNGRCPQSHLLRPTLNVCAATQLRRRNMANDAHRDGFQLPAPPPALHTRGIDMGGPGTPSQEAFTSPQQTPQGSPSKHHQPPGAFDLPHVFENAMRLLPTMGGSPSKSKPGSPTSPNKGRVQGGDDADPFAHDATTLTPGSPTRRSNQENTPPNGRPGLQKESSYLTHAAQSRQEPYRTHGADQSTRYHPGPQRLSAEDLEKARKPSVKRLANVTQLCKCGEPMDKIRSRLTRLQISSTTTLTSLLTSIHAKTACHSSRRRTPRPPPRTRPSTTMPSHNTLVVNEPTCASDAQG
jgi:hypothetical protein